MKNSFQKTIYYSMIIIVAAQLSISLFTANFKISLGVIFLCAFLFLTENFPLIPITAISSVGICFMRMLSHWIKNGNTGEIFSYIPEVCFYICYSILLYIFYRFYSSDDSGRNILVPVLTFIDYTANLAELSVRLGVGAFTLRTQIGILLIAILRSLTIWCILFVFDRYRFLLLQKEHEKRYKRLVLLISKLNGEVAWMNKNTALIEETMSTSYRLYNNLKDSSADPSLATSALSISRDIHEIKKEYLLIMRGISDALNQELESDGMYLEELLSILSDSLHHLAKEQKKELYLTYHCQNNFYTDKHYSLMSIFRNLFINALEAAKDSVVKIEVTQSLENDSYIFDVTDSGPGIPKEYIDEVFKTGFSTKINYTTGEVNRGLGLNLVQDLVEEELKGSITLTSVPGHTNFSIRIPVNQIEVKQS
ncbi:MAG: ATP-binding protein [Lachnospiraceae bacterium]